MAGTIILQAVSKRSGMRTNEVSIDDCGLNSRTSAQCSVVMLRPAGFEWRGWEMAEEDRAD
jgi:hypothetical protein